MAGFFHARIRAHHKGENMSVIHEDKLVLSNPMHFAASLSTLVGFTPTESLVVVMFEQGQVIVTMRTDLPSSGQVDSVHIATTAKNLKADGVLLAFCTDTQKLSDVHSELSILTIAFSDIGIDVGEAIFVIGDRYWSLLQPLSENGGGTVFASVHSPLGQPLAGSREDIAARYVPRPTDQPTEKAYQAAKAQLDVPVRQKCERAWEALNDLATALEREGNGHGRDLLRATIQLAVQDLRARDFVLSNLALTTKPASLIAALVDCALTVTPELSERVCGLAAAGLAACEPSTIPASCMVELAGDDSLAALVRQALPNGIHPDVIREVFTSALPFVLEQIESTESETNENNA